MSEHRSSEFGTALSGLVGIAILVAVVYTLTVARFAGDRDMGTPEQVLARIAPVGSVNLAGAEPLAPVVAPAPAAAEAEAPGLAVYNKACVVCHATGAADAPKLGDKAAWEPRIAQGLDQLLQTAIAGKGNMPPRGTCMDCSDDDLKVAIEYMLGQVGYEPATSSDVVDSQAGEGMSGMGGMAGMSGMSGMGGMPGMSGMSGMGGMPGMTGMSGLSGMSGMPGMSGMGGMSGMSGISGMSGTDASEKGVSSENANQSGMDSR